MPHNVCQQCNQAGRLLDISKNEYVYVDYYRCDSCGHVWNHKKGDPNAPAVHVTRPKTA